VASPEIGKVLVHSLGSRFDELAVAIVISEFAELDRHFSRGIDFYVQLLNPEPMQLAFVGTRRCPGANNLNIGISFGKSDMEVPRNHMPHKVLIRSVDQFVCLQKGLTFFQPS
jgi:hypothetical protein